MKHGTISMYKVGLCRCKECRAAEAEYEADRVRRAAMREFGIDRMCFIDAEPVRAKVRLMLRCGWTARGICRELNVPRSSYTNLMRKHNRTGEPVNRCKRETWQAVLDAPKFPPYRMGYSLSVDREKKAARDRLAERKPYYAKQREAVRSADAALKAEGLLR